MKHHAAKNILRKLKPYGPQLFLLGFVFLACFLLGCTTMVLWPKLYSSAATIQIDTDSFETLSRDSRKRFESWKFLSTQEALIGSERFLDKVAGQMGLASKWGLSNRKTSHILQNSTSVERHGDRLQVNYSSPRLHEAIEVANTISEAYLNHWRNLHNDHYNQMIREVTSDFEDFKAAAKVKVAAFEILNNTETSKEQLAAAREELLLIKEKNDRYESHLAMIQSDKEAVLQAAAITHAADKLTTRRVFDFGLGFSLVFVFSLLTTGITGALLYRNKTRAHHSLPDITETIAEKSNLIHIPRTQSTDGRNPAPFERICTGILEQHPAPEGLTLSLIGCSMEDKTGQLAAELAKVFAAAGHPTLLVEGDLRNPSIHESFSAASKPGIGEFLRGELELAEAIFKTSCDNLWLMPAGEIPESDSRSLLPIQDLKNFLTEVEERFDLIVFAGAPILSSLDPLNLIGETDLTFLTSDEGNASNELLTRTRYAVDEAGGNFSGLILTNARSSDPEPGRDTETESVEKVSL